MVKFFLLLASLSLSSAASPANAKLPICEIVQKELRAIRLVPLIGDGVVKGWAMRDVDKAPQLKKRGLQEYDLLVQIGAQELPSTEAVRQAIEQMCSGKARLRVTRRNKTFTLDLW